MTGINSGNFPICQDGIVPRAHVFAIGNNPGMSFSSKDQLLRRIDERLKVTGKAASAASEDAGLNPGFIRDLKRKKKTMPSIDKIEQLAQALDTTPGWLAFEIGDGSYQVQVGMPVRGEVAAGLWHEVDGVVDANEFERIPIALDPRYPAAAQYGLITRGTSINRVAQPGDILLCLDYAITGIDPRPGDLVIVERTRFQGREREVTAKRIRRDGKLLMLLPDSDDPAWQTAVPINAQKPTDDVEVAVVAIVSGVYRPIRDR